MAGGVQAMRRTAPRERPLVHPAPSRYDAGPLLRRRRHSSVVEQRFCKPLVGGSSPSAGSLKIPTKPNENAILTPKARIRHDDPFGPIKTRKGHFWAVRFRYVGGRRFVCGGRVPFMYRRKPARGAARTPAIPSPAPGGHHLSDRVPFGPWRATWRVSRGAAPGRCAVRQHRQCIGAGRVPAGRRVASQGRDRPRSGHSGAGGGGSVRDCGSSQTGKGVSIAAARRGAPSRTRPQACRKQAPLAPRRAVAQDGRRRRAGSPQSGTASGRTSQGVLSRGAVWSSFSCSCSHRKEAGPHGVGIAAASSRSRRCQPQNGSCVCHGLPTARHRHTPAARETCPRSRCRASAKARHKLGC